jgi:hypothetical protein
LAGSGISPSELQGLSFNTVDAAMRTDSKNAFVADINGEANLLTAFLCKADGDRPVNVCGAAPIHQIQAHLG